MIRNLFLTLIAAGLIPMVGCDSPKGATPPATFQDFPGEDTLEGGRGQQVDSPTTNPVLDEETED